MVRYRFCSLPCTFAKENQLFLDLGLYCGLFAIYLQCQSNKSTGRMATIVFYAICLLYLLSTVNFVIDLVATILEVSDISICSKNIIFLSVAQLRINAPIFSIAIVQSISNGCCDFLAQCILVCINHSTYHPLYSPKSSKIYRCWIVWGQNIRVVIIPLFLAITYLGRSIYFHLISRFKFIASSYLGSANFESFLGPADYNKFRCDCGREWPGDGFNRVQDPQGVLGSQGC